MKYNIYINQKAACDHDLKGKLDYIDLAIFDFVYDFFNCSHKDKVVFTVNNVEYVDIRFELIKEQMPLLNIETSKSFRNRMDKLISAGLIQRYDNNSKENRSGYTKGVNWSIFHFNDSSKQTTNSFTDEKKFPTEEENFSGGGKKTSHNNNQYNNQYIKEKDITKVISKKKEPKESSAKEKVNEDFEKFKEFINKHAPRVAKMQRPFSLEEFIDIKEKYNNKVVRDVLINMDNYRDLNKNISAYRTLCNWINRNEKSNTNHSADSTPTKEAPKNGGFKRILNAEDD